MTHVIKRCQYEKKALKLKRSKGLQDNGWSMRLVFMCHHQQWAFEANILVRHFLCFVLIWGSGKTQ